MNPLWIGTLIMASTGAAGLAVLLARLLRYRHATTGGSPGEFEAERYEPMARLLEEEEIGFLSSESGTDPADWAPFRKRRREIFRLYLQELAADFAYLHTRARELAAVAPEQHAGLVGLLLRQQAAFWWTLAVLEVRLMLTAAGIGRADPSRLLDVVGSLGAAVARATATPRPIPV
jgi:hypothetical protein